MTEAGLRGTSGRWLSRGSGALSCRTTMLTSSAGIFSPARTREMVSGSSAPDATRAKAKATVQTRNDACNDARRRNEIFRLNRYPPRRLLFLCFDSSGIPARGSMPMGDFDQPLLRGVETTSRVVAKHEFTVIYGALVGDIHRNNQELEAESIGNHRNPAPQPKAVDGCVVDGSLIREV